MLTTTNESKTKAAQHEATESTHQPEPFIDRKEVARRLGFDVKTIDKWKEKGFIPYYKINSRVVVFKWSEVEASLKANCRVYQGLE